MPLALAVLGLASCGGDTAGTGELETPYLGVLANGYESAVVGLTAHGFGGRVEVTGAVSGPYVLSGVLRDALIEGVAQARHQCSAARTDSSSTSATFSISSMVL
jgi:hypothetical protein